MKVIETADALSIAERVKNGAKWLQNHAPGYWKRNMCKIIDGKAHFRAKDQYNDECVLALAFEFENHLRVDGTGNVSFARVANHFKLSRQECCNLGFQSHTNEDAEEINMLWEEFFLYGTVGERDPDDFGLR